MDGLAIASLVAAFVSMILAGVAIFLSWQFYRMSIQQADQTRQAASDIKAGVANLQGVFEKLYGDMWSFAKDTMTTVRDHAWPGDQAALEAAAKEAEEKRDKEFTGLLEETREQISSLFQDQQTHKADLEELKQKLDEAVGTRMKEARELGEQEPSDAVLQDSVCLLLGRRGGAASYMATVLTLIGRYPISVPRALKLVMEMVKQGALRRLRGAGETLLALPGYEPPAEGEGTEREE